MDDKEKTCQNIANAIASMIPEGDPYPQWSKESFLKSLKSGSRILDLGCGNSSPKFTKNIIPSCYYIGIDVGDCNQDADNPADEYIIVPSDRFKVTTYGFVDSVDAVISTHNIEHCDDRYGVVDALAKSLKVGGKAYISFPCAESVGFPSRRGTLNYYDDGSHIGEPPDFGKIISILSQNGLSILYAASRFQPPIHWVLGLGNEDQSAQDGDLKDGTWCYWGFESLIVAERK